MKKILFPILIAISALLVSGSAAFYSVFGLSKLFSGASTQVIIMAGSLEFAKLIVASLLYQYWGTINKWLRTYLSIAVLVLMVITSGGIYGFLSGAYQETATKSEFLDKSLAVLEIKQERFEENKTDLKTEKNQLNKSISDLRISLSNPAQVQYVDKASGQLITTTSSSSRRALQKELDKTIEDRNTLSLKLEVVQDSITSLDTRLLELEISNEDERELGPLKYLAETTGQDMGQVVNWFLLLIVFVFDPLAIAMVVAANFAFAQIRKPEDNTNVVGKPNKEVMIEKKDLIMDDMEEVKKYPTTEDIIKFNREKPIVEHDGMRYNPEKPEETLEFIDEKRMDIIGQNGNDGLHYDEEHLEEVNQSIHKELFEEEQKERDIETKPKMSVKEKIKNKSEKQRLKNSEGFQGYTIRSHAQPIINPDDVLRYRNNRK